MSMNILQLEHHTATNLSTKALANALDSQGNFILSFTNLNIE
jgi:hypothetical protein